MRNRIRARAAAIPDKLHRAVKLEIRAAGATGSDALPQGVCGRVSGIALVYDVLDDYQTMFAPGCLDKTRAERVTPGKVQLFSDHDPFTHSHVGVIRSINDVGGAAVMVADLFDTEAGLRMKQYLEAVIASGAETGLSVGFRRIKSQWMPIKDTPAKTAADPMSLDDSVLVFQEISLREVSITPVPAVPGAEVTGVRRDGGAADGEEEDAPAAPAGGPPTEAALLRRMLAHILRELPEAEARAEFDAAYASRAAAADTPAAPAPEGEANREGTADAAPADGTPEGSATTAAAADDDAITDDERMALLRQSFAVT